jgi:hypothetical protein
VRFAEQGLLPNGGGTNDQTPSFLGAMDFIQRDERRIRNEQAAKPFQDD